ncbi:MAG: hypothetical protein EOP47_28770 [Sphingobacteriaceae bacterium]|nr:MAG: hypothetical protein EOP47_28770 [Sphingobacteriaceae bacterium]
MTYSINWKGLDENQTLEHCTLNINNRGVDVQSTIEGFINNIPFNAGYRIITDSNWRTTGFAINYQSNGIPYKLSYTGDANGNWLKDGIEQPLLTGCIEIDITATPFTNALAINRLRLAIGESGTIKVLYVDTTENTVTATEQIYTRVDNYIYHFATSNFKAEIQFDEMGFVVEYPGLFTRVK